MVSRTRSRKIRKSTSFGASAYSTCRERGRRHLHICSCRPTVVDTFSSLTHQKISSFICGSPAAGAAFTPVAADMPSWTPSALYLTHQKVD